MNNEKRSCRSVFNITLSCLIALSILIFWGVTSAIDPMIVASISPIILFLGTFLVAVLGSVMAGVRGNIPVQLIGFSLVPIALGFISAPWFASVEHEILYEAGVLTLLALGVMMIASAMFPAFFQRIMGFLMIALIGLILVSLVAVFFLKIEMTLIHILSVVIFMGFLGFDLVMARTVEPTLTNAIALSTSIFIDLLNIFMNLAQLLGDD